MKERVVNLEAQQPHINAALVRIEGSVDKMVDKLSKAVWVIILPILGVLGTVVVKVIFSGALSHYI